MKRGFGSDNHSGASPEIIRAIEAANKEHAIAYGDDEYSEAARAIFKKHFGEKAEVYFVFNGTGANVLSIDLMCRSHHAVVCAETAHIFVDECGAPQRIVGSKLLPIKTTDGKLTPQLVATQLHGFGFEHHAQPKAISITQPTELGTLYSLDEVKALADMAHKYNMYLHIDGARLANAAVSLGCSFKEMTSDLGVDIISFGGTKNGMIMGESCVVLNEKLNNDAKYRRKQMGQLCSKMRFVAAQFIAYLEEGVWERNARHSNLMANRLHESVKNIAGLEIVYKVQANSVFVRMKREAWKTLQNEYFFYDWDEDDNVVRWMCSFDTTEEDIDKFVGTLRDVMNTQ